MNSVLDSKEGLNRYQIMYVANSHEINQDKVLQQARKHPHAILPPSEKAGNLARQS